MNYPFISIVVPIYNRVELLSLCLPPLFNQSYPRQHYEIILIDDGSTDNTAQIAEEMARGWDGKFTLIRQKNMGAGAARNAGIAAAIGEYVACIDSDCEAGSDWLLSLVEDLIVERADAIGGPINTGNLDNLVCRYFQVARFHHHKVRDGVVEYLITGNVLFRRKSILAIGQFETGGKLSGEDVDISYRLRQHGYKMAVTNRGSVIHYGDPTSINQFWQRLRLHGQASVELVQRWPGSRSIGYQLMRRIGALFLSPILAFRLGMRDSQRLFFWFWLCLIVQHSAFVIGMFEALIRPRQEI